MNKSGILIATMILLGVPSTGLSNSDSKNLESRLLQVEFDVWSIKEKTEELEQHMQHFLEKPLESNTRIYEGAIQSTPAGDLPVSQDTIRIPGFDCGNGEIADGDVFIYFPSAIDQTYPIVSFLHGSGGGRFDDLCRSISSLGMVVVAVSGGVCGDWSNQQVHAVQGARANQDLHPVLSHVDFTSVGVIGHSQGGAYTTGTAAFHNNDINIKAAVMSHGGSPNASPKIPEGLPVMFATGSKDPKRHKLWWAYDATAARPAIYSSVNGATHMAPAHSGPQNAFMAHFLGCYLLPRQKSCDLIFGDCPDCLCHHNMETCVIRLPNEDDPFAADDYADPVPAIVGSTPAGDYQVSVEGYSLPGFDCGDGTQQNGWITIYFPSALDGTFPIASFLHGSGSGRFEDLNANIASLGIVVVAVHQGTCGRWSTQQIHAVIGSQANQDLHPALKHVDYTSIGVIGHSEGGAYTMESATWAGQFDIKAAVASHGGSQNAAPSIPKDLPIMFVSGTGDKKQHKLWWAYQDTQAVPRIFASMQGDDHMAPLHGSPINTMMAHFLGCYLLPRKESCDIIYGDGPDSLCKAHPMGTCVIVKEFDVSQSQEIGHISSYTQ